MLLVVDAAVIHRRMGWIVGLYLPLYTAVVPPGSTIREGGSKVPRDMQCIHRAGGEIRHLQQ